MRYRVLYPAGSPAATIVGRLPETFVPLPVQPLERIVGDDPAVLVIDAAADDLARAEHWRITTEALEVIALVKDAAAHPELPDAWYAFLPARVAPAILAKTVQNAHEHMTARGELARLGKELHDLNDIGVRLSAERDLTTLLELILTKAREITVSDAGSLYLVEPEGDAERRLRFTLAQNDSLHVPFKEFTMPLNEQSIAGYVALTGTLVNLEDAYAPPAGSPFQVNRAFDQQVGYRTKSMLVVPMTAPKGEIVGVLQLINCKPEAEYRFASPDDIEANAQPYGRRYAELARSLASQAAVALENGRLYENIQSLFEGFVKASVTAIESRDPTTSGHSFRVADLTVGLADAVNRTRSGLLAAIHFTPDEMKEIRYASLLHDFGKVGVREEVLVKAKKLYPGQIELIKQRVEIIRRGIELRYSRRKLEYLLQKGAERFTQHADTLDAELTTFLGELEDGLKHVIAANEPAVMAEDSVSLIQRVALRTFEDHLGEAQAILTPEEACILTIPKGSLTDEERKQIESHVVHTFQFLSQIPWTKEIRNVPLIARSHHEKLNGTGYPFGMTADEIPVQSKMMAIADIYDALTAADRPYKKAIPVERALDILDYERKAGHVDGALLDLFVTARIFERARGRDQ